MTDLLVDMSEYIISQDIAVESGIDIFQNFFPPDPDEIIALVEYAGSPPAMGTDVSVRSVQIKVRSTSNEQARTKIWEVYNALYNYDNPARLINNRPVLCKPRQSPFRLETDTNDRVVWCFNMAVTTHNEI